MIAGTVLCAGTHTDEHIPVPGISHHTGIWYPPMLCPHPFSVPVAGPVLCAGPHTDVRRPHRPHPAGPLPGPQARRAPPGTPRVRLHAVLLPVRPAFARRRWLSLALASLHLRRSLSTASEWCLYGMLQCTVLSLSPSLLAGARGACCSVQYSHYLMLCPVCRR